MATVLVILPDGFEEIEAVTPIDLLIRAGVEVTTAALGDAPTATGRSGLALRTTTTLATVGDKKFDLLLLPGGPGFKALRADPRVIARVKAQATSGGWIAAICAAPTVLHDAGILAGRRYTAHFSVASELTEILTDERVVVDGNIITSRGAGTALEFGLTLVEKLVSESKARDISAAICA